MSDTQYKKCSACHDPFRWNDDVIIADDEFYHANCVEVYATGYIAFLDGDPLGETENEDGDYAFDVLGEGEYLEEEE